MATVYFSLSAKLIGGKKQVMVRFGGTGFNQRAKSGIYVNPTYWDDLTQGIVIPKPRLMSEEMVATIKELRVLDSQLRNLRQYIEDAFIKDTSAPAKDSNWLKDVVDVAINGEEKKDEVDFWGAWELFITSKMVSSQRRKLYNTVRSILTRFEKVKKYKVRGGFAFDLHTFSPILLSEFERYLYEEDTYVEKYPDVFKGVKLREGRGGVKRGANTVSGRLDIFRTFYLWANKKGLTNNDPFKNFSIKSPVYGTPIYITKEERDLLYNTEMGHETLNRIRDIFVFQSHIGCRAGDMLSFTKSNIIDGCLEYIPSKTAHERPRTVSVPLNKVALEILAKYEDPKRKALLPFPSMQRYNVHIKECFKKAGLSRLVTHLNPRTGKYEQVPLHEKATSHMARKTFVGNLYSQVKDPNLIASLSGHSENSKSFNRYRDIDKQMKEELVKLLE